jgi:hypothetical protein
MALKLRLVPRPALTARVAPRLGATIAAEAPLASALAGGAYTLSLDVAGLAALSSLPAAERDNLFVPLYNSDTGSFRKLDCDTLLDELAAGLSFDDLAPTTTRGDIIVRNATTNARLPAGPAGYHLQMNGAGTDPTWSGFLQAGNGAFTRTWQDKARDVLNANDFGIDTTGATDQTSVLQTAMDAAASQNKRLILAGGTIKILGTLIPPLNCVMEGQGPELTTIYAPTTFTTTFDLTNGGAELSNFRVVHELATRNFAATTFDAHAAGSVHIYDVHLDFHGVGIKINNAGLIGVFERVTFNNPVFNGIDFDVSNTIISSILSCLGSHDPGSRGFAHVVVRNLTGQLQVINSNFFQAGFGLCVIPGNGQSVTLISVVGSTYFDSNPSGGVALLPSGTGVIVRCLFTDSWITGTTNAFIAQGNGANISDIQIQSNKIIASNTSLVAANLVGIKNLQFGNNVLINENSSGAAATFDNIQHGDVFQNTFDGPLATGFFITNGTDFLSIHHHDFTGVTAPISVGTVGSNNRWRDNIGLANSPVYSVVEGGTGASTLTGLLQGNGTSACTTIGNSSTIGQVLRVTGANTYAWGAVDLADNDAIAGDLPFSNLSQGSAFSVLGVSGNVTADFASIIAGSDNQVLRRSGTSIGFGAINLASSNAVTGDLPFANLTQASARSVLGVTGNVTADVASIQSSAGGQVLNSTSTSVAWTTTPTLGVPGATRGTLTMAGNASGSQVWQPAATTAGTITWPSGTVDFSSTGGASQVIKQASTGGIFTVGQLAASDLSNGTTGSGSVVLAAAPGLTGAVTHSFASSAGSGTVVGFTGNVSRTTTSGNTDNTIGFQYNATDSGTTSPNSFVAFRMLTTLSNSNNTSAFNIGMQIAAQVTANASALDGILSGLAVFAGALTSWRAFHASAPSGTVMNKYAFLADAGAGNIEAGDSVVSRNLTAIPSGGTAGAGFMFSSTANFGIFFGSGAPTLSAAKGSLYLRSDGSATNDRAYINTNGSTSWTALTTAS